MSDLTNPDLTVQLSQLFDWMRRIEGDLREIKSDIRDLGGRMTEVGDRVSRVEGRIDEQSRFLQLALAARAMRKPTA